LIGPQIQASDTSSLSPVRQKASEAASLKRASLTVLQAAEKVNKAEKGAASPHAALILLATETEAKISCFWLAAFCRCVFSFYFNNLPRTLPSLYFPVRLPSHHLTFREATLFPADSAVCETCYLTRPFCNRC
jgi:hypothetical protein